MGAAESILSTQGKVEHAMIERWGPGALELTWSDAGLVSLRLLGPSQRRTLTPAARGARRIPERVQRALDAYLAGDGEGLAALPVDIQTSSFGQHVYALLRRVPFGAVCSYGDLARRAGRPGAARAIGSFMNRNPVALVIPCHRVLGADGSLTGYAGGLDIKRWLLQHEARQTSLSV